jgi:TetR/AcrR family transcriptional repressor of bet genes
MAALPTKSARRTATKEERRQQLIDATVKCIARKGIGSTTRADVAQEAGLSQGIVNLHFNSKENLLNETLQYIAEDYKSQFDSTLTKAGPEAAEKLLALMEMDLKPSICDRQKLAVWFSFWGEVKTVPTYQKVCDAYDSVYDEVTARRRAAPAATSTTGSGSAATARARCAPHPARARA